MSCVRSTHELPLAPEVTFGSGFRVRGDNRNEEPAVLDLLANLVVPDIASPQRALVQPDLDAGSPERAADAAGSLGILTGVAQEDRPSRCARRLRRLFPISALLILCFDRAHPQHAAL